MPTGRREADFTFTVEQGYVHIECTHCDWKGDVTPPNESIDMIRQARLEGFEHAFDKHGIHAWVASFEEVRKR